MAIDFTALKGPLFASMVSQKLRPRYQCFCIFEKKLHHENTKFRKHEIYVVPFSCFRSFVLS